MKERRSKMMGKTHAVSGALLYLGTAPVFGVSGYPLVIGTTCAFGAALIPDLDHPSSTIAHTFGWITKLLARGVCKLSGGHRKATHAIIGLIGVYIIYEMLIVAGGWWLIGGITLLFGLALDVVLSGRGVIDGVMRFGTSFILVWFLTYVGIVWDHWVAYAAFIGAVAHSIGDTLTEEGVPWLYPFIKTAYKIPIFRTGKAGEQYVQAGCCLGLIFLVLVYTGQWHDIVTYLRTVSS